MIENAKWIWLDKENYPEQQSAPVSMFDEYSKECKFKITDFYKEYCFEKDIKSVNIDISADVKFWLYVNDSFVGQGPVGAGGDYGINRPMPYQYYNSYVSKLQGRVLSFYIMVQNMPTVLCDMSHGKNGLIISATVIFDDGTTEEISTDETWKVRINHQRYAVNKTDFRNQKEDWSCAETINSVWNLKKPNLRMLEENIIYPKDFCPVEILPGEIKEFIVHYDKIYSIYHHLIVDGDSTYCVNIGDFERYEEKLQENPETVVANGYIDFRGLSMVSAGGHKIAVHNTGDKAITVKEISAYFTHYPLVGSSSFECSEECFNKIYNMGKHALKICRQTIELDSPLHQENLGCAGDYFIASLMNYFTDGDTALTRLDIARIADCLKLYDGYMFHTTYSMIWIMMVWDYYMFSGDETIFREVSEALEMLLEKMHSYTDDEEIIVNPPSYMFVDWLVVDGISLHHPPMALGQSVLNAFYYAGLRCAVKIFQIINCNQLAGRYTARADVLKNSFHKNFYDENRKLYFDGKNDSYRSNEWLPENVDKRYFSWHTNTLAVLYDLAPRKEQRRIVEDILNDQTLIDPQPYFMHFVLEAIYKVGLFEKYGIFQLMRWKDMTEFEKGLQEGWYDMSGYGFDYSHVWCGTPTYQLPSKFSGFEMLEPGFKKVRLKPSLFGLEYAKMTIPSPFGEIMINMQQGRDPEIYVPSEIELA